MNEKNLSDLSNIDRLTQIIQSLKEKANLSGIILSYRDGRPIVKEIEEVHQIDQFIPLIASALRSAEDLGITVNGSNLHKIIAQLENVSIMILKCSGKDVFLTLIINEDSNLKPILENYEELSKKIANHIEI